MKTVHEMIASLREDLGLPRDRLAVQSGLLYYKIQFVFRNTLCTIINAHSGSEVTFTVGTIDGGNYENFMTWLLALPEGYED